MTKAVELQTALVAELKTLIPPDNFTIQCLLEPLPAFFAQHSLDHGGNVLGLDTLNKDGIVWLGTAMVSTVEQQAIVQPRMAGWAATLQAYAESVGGNQPLRYLNYADGTQDPLRSYGSANVEFIAKVAAEYDPKGVFQKQVPGGFKISRI